jgi:hypothetical protein
MKMEVQKLLGGKCANCGCAEPILLQVNHKRGDGLKDHKLHGSTGIYSQIRVGKRNLADYDLRCLVCNPLYYVELTWPKLAKHYMVTWKA